LRPPTITQNNNPRARDCQDWDKLPKTTKMEKEENNNKTIKFKKVFIPLINQPLSLFDKHLLICLYY